MLNAVQRARLLIARGRNGGGFSAAHLAVEEARSMDQLLEAMRLRPPAVLLLALDFPGLRGPAAIRHLRMLSPATKIVVVSRAADEHEELTVLRMGARGYCGPVEAAVLLKMIDKVQQGEIWAGRRTIGALLDEFYAAGDDLAVAEADDRAFDTLTAREREILRLLAGGLSNKEIATALNVTVSTVKAHLTKMFRKLGRPDRLHLALYAAKSRRPSQ